MRAKQSGPSRRAFLSGAAALSAYFLDSETGEGLFAGRVARHGRRRQGQAGHLQMGSRHPGALCVDLDKMEKNIATMQAALKKYGLPSRPHSKTHKCAAIAKYQLATGSIGICCAKLSEAEAMVANGVDKILMTTVQPVEEQDPPRDEHQEVPPRLHSGRGRRAERAGSLRRRQRGRRRGRRRHRRRRRDAQRDPAWSRRAGAGPADRQAAQSQAARNPLVRRRRAAREGVREPQGAGAEDHRPERRNVRDDEEGRAEHGDLQRRRNRHLQHHASRARIHRRAGRQLSVHGHAVPGHWQRERRRRLHRLRAVADRSHDGDEQQVPGPVDDRRGREGADAQHAECRRHRRARHGLHRRARTSSARSASRRRPRRTTRSATSSRSSCRTAIRW